MIRHTSLFLLLAFALLCWSCEEERDFTSSVTPEDIALNMVPIKGNGNIKSFSIGKYEVTQDEWMAVMEHNPSRVIGNPQRPVDSATPQEIDEFIRRLNELTGKAYTLPTSDQWRYASAGGGSYEDFSGSTSLNQVGWYEANSGGKPHPVGEKSPNAFGLYDMSGNVMELTQYGMYCGGSWNSPEEQCRTYASVYEKFDTRVPVTGFRLALNEYDGPEDEYKSFTISHTETLKDVVKNQYYILTYISFGTTPDEELLALLRTDVKIRFDICPDTNFGTDNTVTIYGTRLEDILLKAYLPTDFKEGNYYLRVTVEKYRSNSDPFIFAIDNSFTVTGLGWDYDGNGKPYLFIDRPTDADISAVLDKVKPVLVICPNADFRKDTIPVTGTVVDKKLHFPLPLDLKPGTYYLRFTIGNYTTKIVTWVYDPDKKYKEFAVEGLTWDFDVKDFPYLRTEYPASNEVGTLLSNGTNPIFELCTDINFTKNVLTYTGVVNHKNKLVASLPQTFKAGTYYVRITIGLYRTVPMKLLIQCDQDRIFSVGTPLEVKYNANKVLSLYTPYPTEFGVVCLLENPLPPTFEISKDNKMVTGVTKITGSATKPNLIAALPDNITSGTYYVRISVGRYRTAILSFKVNLDDFYTAFTLSGVDWDYDTSFRMVIKTTGYPQDANVQAALSKGEFPIFEMSKDAQFSSAQAIQRYDGDRMNQSYLYAQLAGTFDPSDWYVRIVIGNYRSNVMPLSINYKQLTVDPVTFKYSSNSTLTVNYEMPRYLDLFQNYGYARLYTSTQANAQPYKTLAGKYGINNQFTFTDVAPGTYYLRFELGLYRSAFITVKAEAADLPSFLEVIVVGISPTQMYGHAYIKLGTERIVRQGFCYYVRDEIPDITAPTVEATINGNEMSAIIESPYFTPATNTFRAFLETENGDIIYSDLMHPIQASKLTARITTDQVTMTDAQYSPGGFTADNGVKYDYQYEIELQLSLFGSVNVTEWGFQNLYPGTTEWTTLSAYKAQDGHFTAKYNLLTNSPDLTTIKTRVYAKLTNGEYIYSSEKAFNIQYTKSKSAQTKASTKQEFSITNIKYQAK